MDISTSKKYKSAVYISLLLTSIILAFLSNYIITTEIFKAITVNLASELLAVGILFFIVDLFFSLTDDDRPSPKDYSQDFSEVLDRIASIKDAVIFPSGEIGLGDLEVNERQNKGWLWKTCKRELTPDLEKCLDRIEAIMEELDKSENKKTKERYELKEDNRMLKEEITSLKVEQESLKGRIQSIFAELQLKNDEIIKKTHELELKDEDLRKKRKIIEDKDEDLRDKDRLIKEMSSNIASLEKKVSKLTSSYEAITSNISNLNASFGNSHVDQELTFRKFQGNLSLQLERTNYEFAEMKSEVAKMAKLLGSSGRERG